MTKKIWEFSETKVVEKNDKVKWFLILNSIIWCLIGAVIWMAVGRIVLKEVVWLFIFSGYASVFMGLIGGTVYAMNQTHY